MTELMQKALGEIEKLSIAEQDAIAERILTELTADQTWNALFAKTTDEQWQKMAARVDEQVREGKTMPLEEFLAKHQA
ncbi:MAG: hypothetical protein HUU46_13705 [Candidatus Hydrogenedentes bacterium]|nr:hypothetical protein [Candidatus Hydrogenedentota bacterium]